MLSFFSHLSCIYKGFKLDLLVLPDKSYNHSTYTVMRQVHTPGPRVQKYEKRGRITFGHPYLRYEFRKFPLNRTTVTQPDSAVHCNF